METQFDYKEVLEIGEAAQVYLDNLNCLKIELSNAHKQVEDTFETTTEKIHKTFSVLRGKVLAVLKEQEDNLLKKAQQARDEGLLPIEACMKCIDEKLENTTSVINLAKVIKPGLGYPQLLKDAEIIGNLPEIPEPKDVPFISFIYEPSCEEELINLCSAIGDVSRLPPVQIKSLLPKPGGILIEWQPSYESSDKDIQEFRLQRAYGDVIRNRHLSSKFMDIYQGPDSQYLLRDIQILQKYSFRICCKFEGATQWSPWSVPQVGLTDKKWFSWEQSEGATLSNENKILKIDRVGKIVYSDEPPVSFSDSVEFTVLEVDPTGEAVIGLTIRKCECLEHLRHDINGSFLINSAGGIFIDGVEKSTVLPRFTKHLKICFTLEESNSHKVRVNVDVGDKRVTYDWTVGDSCTVYFACQSFCLGWKFMVE